MILYKYKAAAKNGEKLNGVIFAKDYDNAYKILTRKNYLPLEIDLLKQSDQKLDPQDVLVFFLHLNFQLKCGMTIDNAIESFIESRGNKILKALLSEILYALHNGESIGDSFERCGELFDSSIIGLLKSAQATGNITEVIKNIIDFLKFQNEWKNKVRQATAYPLFALCVSIFVLIFATAVLGPQVSDLLQNNTDENQLPLFTVFTLKILPYLSDLFYVSAFIFFTIIIVSLFSKKIRNVIRNMILKIPGLNSLMMKICLWQFFKTLSIALYAKLDFIKALETATDAVKISDVKQKLECVADLVKSGYSISESFSRMNLIPAEIITVIYVGEAGNNLSESFKHISDNQSEEILFDIRKFGRNLSIGLTILTGTILIFILCGLFYPIYGFIEIAGQ